MAYTNEERQKIVDMSHDARAVLDAHIRKLVHDGLNQNGDVVIDPSMVLQSMCYACGYVIGELTVTGIKESYRDLFVQDFVLKAITSGQESAMLRVAEVEGWAQEQVDEAIKKASSRKDLH